MDDGRRILSEVRPPGAPLLDRALDPRGVWPQAGLYLHPDMQAVARLPAMAVRVSHFLPAEMRTI